MSRSTDHAGKQADRARTRFSNKSLAKGRRGTPDLEQLTPEQEAYKARFRKTTNRPDAVIEDVNGNYPDMPFTRTR